ncbi:MAG TPA: TRAP transporter small permease [Pseudorhodoplanes sp.]|nr:TRAP transporter small permease [Pseudorhodoplanes sp.]
MESVLSLSRKAVRFICLVLLAALIVTPLLQIVMRGIFNVPMSGAEELARYFLICLSFIGASYVTLEGGQIRMEEIQALIPPMPRWLLQMGIELCGVAVFGIFLVASVVTIANNLRNQTPTLEMPFWLFMAPLAVGSLLLIVETMAMFVHTLRRGRPEAKQTVLT